MTNAYGRPLSKPEKEPSSETPDHVTFPVWLTLTVALIAIVIVAGMLIAAMLPAVQAARWPDSGQQVRALERWSGWTSRNLFRGTPTIDESV